jgi:D-3-phosphoglycerate dehydrogenase / 2-oxoglutarate reductase
MKVLVCDKMAASAVDAMRAAGLDVDVKTGMTPEELVATVPGYHAALVRSATKFRKEAIDAATDMQLIVRGGVGLDNIDVAYAESKGISVRNTPAASSASVAELAIGFMFALARKIPQATISMKDGKWEKKAFDGIELGGKTLGVVGAGRIGQEIIKRAQALGMDCVFYRRTPTTIAGAKQVSLEELLKVSDFISMNVPKTGESTDMIGAAQFAMMKDGVYIVHCGRGGTLNEDALLDALNSGKVAGAALDVFAQEPTPNTALLSHPNVIASPHVGAQTSEGQERVGDEVVSIVVEFARSNA